MKTKLTLGLSVFVLLLTSCSKDPYEKSIYSEQPVIGLYQDYLSKNSSLPKDGSDAILKLGEEKGIIKKSGLLFKDSNGNEKLDPYEDWRLPVKDRATDLVNKMTAEEKIGLINYEGNVFNKYNEGYGIPGLDFDGEIKEDSIADFISLGYRHSNTNLTFDPLDTVKFLNNVQGATERLPYGIPHLFTMEPGHDMWDSNEVKATKQSPWPFWMGLGSIDDLGTTKKFAKIMREELRMSGRHGLFGPMAELATEPRWARVNHAIHANENIVSSHIEVFIKALQGFDLDKNDIAVNGALAVLKHFPGTGSVEEGMDNHTLAGAHSVFPGNNYEEHLAPYINAIKKAKPAAIMTAYSVYDTNGFEEVAAAYNKSIITDLLRDKLGFEGAIITDNGVLTSSAWGVTDLSIEERIADLMDAGIDQYLPGKHHDDYINALGKGLITEDQINNAAIHSLSLQFQVGLFENPYVDISEAEAFWDPNGKEMQKRVETGIDTMRKAMVLAKNIEIDNLETELLPIKGGNPDYKTAADINGNGLVDVYFDSAFPEADSGQKNTYAISTDEKYKNINFVDDISKADIAIARIWSRGGTYFGTTGTIPLDYDTPAYVWDRENQQYTTEEIPVWQGGFPGPELGKWVFSDWSNASGTAFLGQGYRTLLGYSDSKAVLNKFLAAKSTNPKLKVVIGLTLSRAAIVSSYINKIDGMFFDFASTDSAFLDVVFWQNGAKPEGRLPMEIPTDNESANEQFEDLPNDTKNATFEVGYGLDYITLGGYGN